MFSGGGGVDQPVVPTAALIQREHGFVMAEVQRAIQCVLDVLSIAAASAQDVIHNQPVFLCGPLLKVGQAPHQVEKSLMLGAAEVELPPFALARPQAVRSLACFVVWLGHQHRHLYRLDSAGTKWLDHFL